MSWGPLLVNLAVTAGLVAVLMLATFGYAMRTRVHAIMDTIWPLGFVLIAVVSFGLSAGSGVAGRRVLVLVLTAVWGLRLGAHIYTRNRGQGEDKRYASLLRRNRGSLAAFVLRYIYWMQGRVMWFVSLPVQAAMYEHAPLGLVSWLGAAVWAVGFGFEAVGDAQLRRFRADPANAGRVLDRGLWRYTRHPNYFGDATVWFGLWLLACSHWLGLVLVASPVYMTNMLVRHTGKRLLEKHMARSKGAAYADYVRRTSGFIPRPPREGGAGPANTDMSRDWCRYNSTNCTHTWRSGTPFRCQFQTGASPGSAARTVTTSRSWSAGSGGSSPSGTRKTRFPPSCSTENALSRSVAVRMPTRLRFSRA